MVLGEDEKEAIKLWRRYSKDSSTLSLEHSYKIGLISTFTIDSLIPHLGGHLLKKGIENPSIRVAPYNQVHQSCLDHLVAFGTDKIDVIAIFWRLEDLFSQYISSLAKAEEDLIAELDQLIDVFVHLRTSFKGSIVIYSPPYPYSSTEFYLGRLNNARAGLDLFYKVSSYLSKSLSNVAGIQLADLNGILMESGYGAAHDVRKWYLYKQPYSEGALSAIGRDLARRISALTQPSKKCLVLDCDNTLWGGVVGEDGIKGIDVGDSFPGLAFKEFQAYIKYLSNSGVLLAIASKNNEADVLEVFERHDSMVLKTDDISIFQVHWQSKVNSICHIAEALNIGLDSLVFIDDNPKEIEEVRTRLPEVICFQIPEDESSILSEFKKLELFDGYTTTLEDQTRLKMLEDEKKRGELRSFSSEKDFLASLQLKVSVFAAAEEHVSRVVQLINKTNQFNLTTKRRTSDEVCQLIEDGDHQVFAMKATDKYGDYGLVGVAILKNKSANVWHLDSFLLSCRILGRKAETAFLSGVLDIMEKLGCIQLTGQYIESPKNTPAESFLTSHGFTEGVDSELLELNLSERLGSPEYILIEVSDVQ